MKESQTLRVIDHVQEEYGTGAKWENNYLDFLSNLFLIR